MLLDYTTLNYRSAAVAAQDTFSIEVNGQTKSGRNMLEVSLDKDQTGTTTLTFRGYLIDDPDRPRSLAEYALEVLIAVVVYDKLPDFLMTITEDLLAGDGSIMLPKTLTVVWDEDACTIKYGRFPEDETKGNAPTEEIAMGAINAFLYAAFEGEGSAVPAQYISDTCHYYQTLCAQVAGIGKPSADIIQFKPRG